MKLTSGNYFTSKNKHLSKSKLWDWKKDKEYFYKKNVTGEIEFKVTDPIIIGSAVDTWVTGSEEEFRKQYNFVTRRSRKQGEWRYQLNPTMYSQIEKLSRVVTSQHAYKDLKDYTSQQILQVDRKIGDHFEGLCGIPDWFKVEKDRAIIVDLKTTDDANQQKYFYKCEALGYFTQMAFYAMLIAEIYKIPFNNIEYKHLVVEKDRLGINNCYAFELSPDRVETAHEELLEIIEEIRNEKEFAKHNANWDNPIMI